MDHTIVHRAAALLQFRADLLTIYPGLTPNPAAGVAKITVTTPAIETEEGPQNSVTHTFDVTEDAMVSFYNWIVAAYGEAGTLLAQAGVTGFPGP